MSTGMVEKVNELRDELRRTRELLDTANATLARVEAELAESRARADNVYAAKEHFIAKLADVERRLREVERDRDEANARAEHWRVEFVRAADALEASVALDRARALPGDGQVMTTCDRQCGFIDSPCPHVQGVGSPGGGQGEG